MKNTLVILSLMACMALASCNTKQSAINDLRNFRNEIVQNGSKYSVSDWIKAKERYDKVSEKLDKHRDKFTYEESRQIGQLKGECIATFGKNVIENIGNKALNAKGEIEGIVDGVKGTFGNKK